MKNKKQEKFDDSFYRLAEEVTTAIENNKDGTDQQQQVEELLDAEKKFKETILRYRQSTEVYKKFLQKICIQNKNILSARPYFRETAISFSKKVTPAIKERNVDLLKTFDINFQLIKFIRDSWLGPFPKRAEQLYHRVYDARRILIENNMPLAINRAKLFYRKTPRSHLTLMDLIGICGLGLAAGVDKWCGPYSKVFRSVCIGRMVGNMIDLYSETTLHFFPSDRRILYKANTIRGRQGIEELEELANAINDSFSKDKEEGKSIPKEIITVSNLHMLMNAASPVSADATVNDENYGVYSYVPDENQNIEEEYIRNESMSIILAEAKKLPLLHKKILQLRGIKI